LSGSDVQRAASEGEQNEQVTITQGVFELSITMKTIRFLGLLFQQDSKEMDKSII